MNDLNHYKKEFGRVGWFIPPYVSRGYLDFMLFEIERNQNFTQRDLESLLSRIYAPAHLASMVVDRYPKTKFISEYKKIISESVQAHFFGLDHVAVAGIMPVIEGASKKIARDRNVPTRRSSTKDLFLNLASDCKKQVQEKEIGIVGEVISMLDSFAIYAETNLYIDSDKYPHDDKTNRQGILHGSYADEDYGTPLNFYKSIAAVDFLCFITTLKHKGSWFAPDPSEGASSLAKFYLACSGLRGLDGVAFCELPHRDPSVFKYPCDQCHHFPDRSPPQRNDVSAALRGFKWHRDAQTFCGSLNVFS